MLMISNVAQITDEIFVNWDNSSKWIKLRTFLNNGIPCATESNIYFAVLMYFLDSRVWSEPDPRLDPQW